MVMTDPIADFLTRIRNGYLARKKEVKVPHSKLKKDLAQILVKEGYLKKVALGEGSHPKKRLILTLKYQKRKPTVKGIERLSKPGVRLYARVKKIPRVRWGKGIVILSTSKGLMTDKEARKKKMGGELICQIW